MSLRGDLRDRKRVGILIAGDSLRQKGRARSRERWRWQPGDERQGEHGHDRHRDEKSEERDRPNQVAADHHRPSRQPVAERREYLADADPRQDAEGDDQRRERGRIGAFEHEDGEGDSGRPVADLGEDLRGEDDGELAARQWRSELSQPVAQVTHLLDGRHGRRTSTSRRSDRVFVVARTHGVLRV